jgi:hypothetical protein
MISAHESPLAAMAFDMSGTKLATASNKVFRILRNTLYELIFIALRERLFEFIVQLMVHDFSNFVEEFDGMYIELNSILDNFDNDSRD